LSELEGRHQFFFNLLVFFIYRLMPKLVSSSRN